MAALPLAERIRQALAEPSKADDVATLLGEVKIAESAAQAAFAAAQVKALDPSLSDSEASLAQQDSVQREFARNRLGAAIVELGKREGELRKAEEAERSKRARDEAMSQRDELAAVLADRWPKLADEMLSLLIRLKESNARIPSSEVSAEVVARNLSPTFERDLSAHTAKSLLMTALPAFDPKDAGVHDSGLVWHNGKPAQGSSLRLVG